VIPISLVSANLQLQDNRDRTAMQSAEDAGKQDVVAFLRDHGAHLLPLFEENLAELPSQN
jgi:ankyrin repeat protein